MSCFVMLILMPLVSLFGICHPSVATNSDAPLKSNFSITLPMGHPR